MAMTNTEYSKTDSSFGKACVIANVKATSRQASKFRRGKGIAWKVKTGKAFQLRNGMPGYKDYS